MKAWVFRGLVCTHRYLGIALGLLMLVWCLSGFVMLYVPFPELAKSLRLGALPTLDQKQCCVFSDSTLDDAAPVGAFELEMLGNRLLLRVTREFGPASLIEARSGEALAEFDASTAEKVAQQFAQMQNIKSGALDAQLIERDQWTVYGGFDDDRPLHRVALNDSEGAEVYVSSVNGRLVQLTTRSERFWNWLGAIPHWLYLTALRQNAALWSQVIIWTSLIGSFLTLFGLWLGVWQLRRKSGGKVASPYRGLKWWHHVPGLVFGVLVLTWVSSGLFSMNPWGLMETQGAAADAARLQGEPPTWREVRTLLQGLSQATLPPNTVSIESAFFGGRLYALARTRNGQQQRFDQHWNTAALSDAEITAAAHMLGSDEASSDWSLLTHEDDYYYSLGSDVAPLPVIRILTKDVQRRFGILTEGNGLPTEGGPLRYYLDPISGALLRKIDRGARSYRWLHSGLHRLDFSPMMRKRPFWDVMMWLLLIGASTVCATGAYMGIRSLVR